jgi:hypothetical protein
MKTQLRLNWAGFHLLRELNRGVEVEVTPFTTHEREVVRTLLRHRLVLLIAGRVVLLPRGE